MPEPDADLDDLLDGWPDADDASPPGRPEASSGGDPLSDCEAAIGHAFADRGLLERALVHASAAPTRVMSNERLEFLGDAVFGAAVCEALYRQFPERNEGELTRIKSAVVSRATCAEMTRDVGLDRYVVVAKGVSGRGGRMPGSILAAVFEAVVAAIYLDAGYPAAAEFVWRLAAPYIEETSSPADCENYKSTLQQQSQRDYDAAPEYAVVGERGPDHRKSFRVAVQIGGNEYPAAWGVNKKEAEQRAAANALASLNDTPLPYPPQTDDD